MILIAVGDEELALAIGRLIAGEKGYALPTETDTELRRRLHEAQPDGVILDVTIGGQRWSAMASIPRIAAVRSSPAIVLVTPRPSRAVDRAAAAWGCYDVVTRASRDDSTARVVAAKIHEAIEWRRDRLFVGVPDGEVLH